MQLIFGIRKERFIIDMDGCITDEDGDIDHEWTGRREEEIEKYFIPYISNKRRIWIVKKGKKV